MKYRLIPHKRCAYIVPEDRRFTTFRVTAGFPVSEAIYIPALSPDDYLGNGPAPGVVYVAAWSTPAVLDLAPRRQWWWYQSELFDMGLVEVEAWVDGKLQDLGRLSLDAAADFISLRVAP